MIKKIWFTNEEKLLNFVNASHVEVVSIIGTNNGNSYQVFYKIKQNKEVVSILKELLNAIEGGTDEGDRFCQWFGKGYISDIRKKIII